MQELAPGVFVETGFRRVTVGAFLTDDGFILIDTPPYPAEAQHWRNMLAGVSEKPILAIVNTDGHPDRIIGNCWFDAHVVVAHDETIAQMQNLPSAFLDNVVTTLTSDPAERSSFSGVQVRAPSVGFTRRINLRYGGANIPLIAMPGPTAGSLWIHFPERRIVFVGDSVLAGQHLYISGPCTKNWLDNLTILRRSRFQADYIVTGRSGIVDKNASEPISNYLRLARRRVQSLYRAGRPRADTSTLVPELLEIFPYQQEDLETVQRRIKTGLDRIYEETKASDTDDEPDESE